MSALTDAATDQRPPALADTPPRKDRRPAGRSHKAGAPNTKLADQATEALVQLNSLLGMGLMLGRMPITATALADAEDGFRESTRAALLADADLCRMILRAGSSGGKVALGVSYAMLCAAVVPVGIMEVKANRAAVGDDGEQLQDRPEVPAAV